MASESPLLVAESATINGAVITLGGALTDHFAFASRVTDGANVGVSYRKLGANLKGAWRAIYDQTAGTLTRLDDLVIGGSSSFAADDPIEVYVTNILSEYLPVTPYKAQADASVIDVPGTLTSGPAALASGSVRGIDSSAGGFGIDLPPAVAGNLPIVLIDTADVAANPVVISPDGADTMQGIADSITFNRRGAMLTLIPLNGQWRLILTEGSGAVGAVYTPLTQGTETIYVNTGTDLSVAYGTTHLIDMTGGNRTMIDNLENGQTISLLVINATSNILTLPSGIWWNRDGTTPTIDGNPHWITINKTYDLLFGFDGGYSAQ